MGVCVASKYVCAAAIMQVPLEAAVPLRLPISGLRLFLSTLPAHLLS
jgi:hypothetical protein